MSLRMWSRLALGLVWIGLLLSAGFTGFKWLTAKPDPRTRLGAVEVWDYQLQKPNLDRLAGSAADLAVIDYSADGTAAGALNRTDVERLRQRPHGGQRLVIAYLSVGEAEEYRFYWRQEWKSQPPDWLYTENCRWPGNHLVRFWMDGWKDIVFRSPDSYLARIVAAGFDGIYVDRIDAYWDLRERYPTGRAQMLTFMQELAETARRLKPGFLIIAQNAEDLLSEAGYRTRIDAIAKEDLLHGVKGTGTRNEQSLVNWSLGQLKLLQQEGKPVFVVEYLRSAAQIATTRRELAALGLRAAFPPRTLDGSDPLAPEPTTAVSTGSPEYGLKHCG